MPIKLVTIKFLYKKQTFMPNTVHANQIKFYRPNKTYYYIFVVVFKFQLLKLEISLPRYI